MTLGNVVMLKLDEKISCCIDDHVFNAIVENVCGVDHHGKMLVYISIIPGDVTIRSYLRTCSYNSHCNELFDERGKIWITPESITNTIEEN